MLQDEIQWDNRRGRRVWIAAAPAALLVLGALSLSQAYAAPGDLDPSFGTGGTTRIHRVGTVETANAMVMQPDGKLIVAGDADTSSGFTLARYNPNGSLDPTFGSAGIVATDVGDGEEIAALVLQPDGKLVAGGFTENAGLRNFALARYNPNGSLDPTFGTGGVVTTDFGGEDAGRALVLQPDGKLVVAGWTDAAGFRSDFALARYNPNGSLDPTFGTGGVVTTDFGGEDAGRALVLQPDGKLVAAGYSYAGGTYDFALARYNPNGSLDPTFGTGGLVRTDLGIFDMAWALVLQPDGKLVVAGSTEGNNQDVFALARYNSNGSLDSTFGVGGVAIDIGAGEEAYALVLQPNGKLVAAGFSYASGTQDFALARYNPNGSLDPTFGVGGSVATDFGTEDAVRALLLQPDGKLVAAGYVDAAGDYDFGLARYEGDAAVLVVETAGPGTGTVTSDVPGIECGLECKASYAQQRTVTLTAVADPGSVFAGYSGDADCADGIVTMHTDMTCLATFTLMPAPDLTGTWRSLTQSCKGEGVEQKCKLKGKVRVYNEGTQKVTARTYLRVYLSTDPVLDGGDTLLRQVTISAMKPGKSKSKKIKYTLPTSQTASGQYIIAVLDATGLIVEQNETNNVLVFGPIP